MARKLTYIVLFAVFFLQMGRLNSQNENFTEIEIGLGYPLVVADGFFSEVYRGVTNLGFGAKRMIGKNIFFGGELNYNLYKVRPELAVIMDRNELSLYGTFAYNIWLDENFSFHPHLGLGPALAMNIQANVQGGNRMEIRPGLATALGVGFSYRMESNIVLGFRPRLQYNVYNLPAFSSRFRWHSASASFCFTAAFRFRSK